MDRSLGNVGWHAAAAVQYMFSLMHMRAGVVDASHEMLRCVRWRFVFTAQTEVLVIIC